MGLEYRIPFRSQDADALNQALKEAPHLANCNEQYSPYEYRANLAADVATMPDATAAVLAGGFTSASMATEMSQKTFWPFCVPS